MEFFGIQMGINLRGGNAGMPKHLLYKPQVCSILKKMSRKRVAKSVWRNIFLNACFSHYFLYNKENHLPRNLRSSAV